jgi:hypothetical protein
MPTTIPTPRFAWSIRLRRISRISASVGTPCDDGAVEDVELELSAPNAVAAAMSAANRIGLIGLTLVPSDIGISNGPRNAAGRHLNHVAWILPAQMWRNEDGFVDFA